jgi:uncharacterized membrane protein
MIEADQSHLIIGVIILVALFIVLFYLIGVTQDKEDSITSTKRNRNHLP